MSYPNKPGHKGWGASLLAALKFEKPAGTLRERTERAFAENRQGMTADYCARVLDESLLSIRPRVSELTAVGVLIKTNTMRECKHTGMRAHVYMHFRHADQLTESGFVK